MSIEKDHKYANGILITWDRIMAEHELNPDAEILSLINTLRP